MTLPYTDVPPTPRQHLSHEIGILDAAALSDVVEIYEAVRHKLEADGHLEYGPTKRYGASDLLRLLETGRMIGAVAGDKAVGFVFMGETSSQNPQDGVPGMRIIYDVNNTAVLRTAMVHPLHQGHGLGRRLFQACTDLAAERGYREIVSGVTAPNVQSWHNLIRSGYRLVQISDLPAEISSDSSSKAFYFHRRFGECSSSLGSRSITSMDPLTASGALQVMLNSGWAQVGFERRDGRIILQMAEQSS